METLIMKGKPVADAYRETISAKIAAARENGVIATLVILIVGNDPASHVYKGRLVKLIESMGGAAKVVEMPEASTQEEVVAAIKKINRNRYIQGVLPMMPMPAHIDGDAVCAAISPHKDVDCLAPVNAGAFFLGRNKWAPCTPRSCLAILDYYGINLNGKHVVVVGRSNVVGKPVANLLLGKNATVTICHSHTQNLKEILLSADVVVAAVGKPCFITPAMVKEGVVIVDVGINSYEGKIVGDVDPEVAGKASAFTPVPGGVGVVSNMMVMECLTRNM